MMRPTLMAAAAAAALCTLSCGDNPTGPSPSAGNRPPVTISPALVGIDLTAPESVAPGGEAQLSVRARRSDGSSEDVTARAQWSSDNPAVLEVNGQGLATGRSRGEARIQARFETRSASRVILVLPDGTFRLSGLVSDTGLGLGDATVQVIGGTGEGLGATTNAGGTYRLYGVAGPIRLHVKRPGYRNLQHDLQVTQSQSFNMEMVPDVERPDVGGAYVMTLTAAACPSAMPADARRRTYDARVEQRDGRLTVRLSGADFVVTLGRGDNFSGAVLPDGSAAFHFANPLGYYYYYSWAPADVVERWSASQVLVITGEAEARLESGRFVGTLNGTISLVNKTQPPFWPAFSACFSASHTFELRR